MMKIALAIFLVFRALNSASAVAVRPCNGIAAPTNVDVKGCSAAPCEMVQGSTTEGELTWTVPQASAKFSLKLVSTALGVARPIPLDEDGCKGLVNSACPLVAAQSRTFKMAIPITQDFALVDADLEFLLVGDNNQIQTCFKLAVKIVGPR